MTSTQATHKALFLEFLTSINYLATDIKVVAGRRQWKDRAQFEFIVANLKETVQTAQQGDITPGQAASRFKVLLQHLEQAISSSALFEFTQLMQALRVVIDRLDSHVTLWECAVH